jgi:nitrate/TMAO reductase-like tetraheme cytochrome c subunit
LAKVKDFISTILKTIPQSKLAILGVIMASVLFPVLLISLVLDWLGVIENPYFSFLFYLVLGPLFILGIFLALLGLLFFRGKEDISLFSYEYLKEQFSKPGRFSGIRRLVYLATFLTSFFLFLVGVTSYTGFQYTDSISFCAQFCHTVMEPEYVTYKNSPHSQVPCVDCHIGESAEWLTKAKITGIKQLFAVVLESYSRPIKTPVSGLRPNRKTCEECHRPEKFHGHKLYFIDKYLADKANTQIQTVLIMKVGYGGHLGKAAHGIHWHTSEKHQVVYTHTDSERKNIIKVELLQNGEEKTTYYKDGAGQENDATATVQEQIMDCIDCHNRPTHIFLSPTGALDQKLFDKEIPGELPYIKRQALAAITKEYKTLAAARKGIASELEEWYQQKYPDIYKHEKQLVEKAISGTQQAYGENVFPGMNIGWNTYEDFIGHNGTPGCFRCHDGSFQSPDGKVISKDCNSCHIILAENEPTGIVMDSIKERCM